MLGSTGVGEGELNQGTLREINVDSYSTECYLPIPLANRAAAIAVSHTGTYVLGDEDVTALLC